MGNIIGNQFKTFIKRKLLFRAMLRREKMRVEPGNASFKDFAFEEYPSLVYIVSISSLLFLVLVMLKNTLILDLLHESN